MDITGGKKRTPFPSVGTIGRKQRFDNKRGNVGFRAREHFIPTAWYRLIFRKAWRFSVPRQRAFHESRQDVRLTGVRCAWDFIRTAHVHADIACRCLTHTISFSATFQKVNAHREVASINVEPLNTKIKYG